MGALSWNDMNNGPEAGPLFVTVTLIPPHGVAC